MGPMSVDSDWLVPIAIRLARAGEISAQIQDAVKRYNESDAIDIEHVIRNDRVTDLVLRIHRHPPARLALLVGEGVHQLRAALDNLIVALADQAAGVMLSPEEVRSLQFPIADTPEKFNLQAKRQLTGLPGVAVKRIEEVQPYHLLDYVFGEPQAIRLEDENLHRLRELSNHDKHRRINVLLHRPDHLAVHHSSAVPPVMKLNTGYVRDGDVVATVEVRSAERIDVTTELAVVHPTTGRPARLDALLSGLLWTVEMLVIPHITGDRDVIGHPFLSRTGLD